jgi:hypothetical protein
MRVFFMNTYKQELNFTALHAVEKRSYIGFDGLHLNGTENVTKKFTKSLKS